jgi:hypothetical protein
MEARNFYVNALKLVSSSSSSSLLPSSVKIKSMLEWQDLPPSEYSDSTRVMVTEAEKQFGEIRFDNSFTVVAHSQWTSYAPSLCASLGLKNPSHIRDIESIEALELGASVIHQFNLENYEVCRVVSSYIKLVAKRDAVEEDGNKLHIEVYRARIDQSLQQQQQQEPFLLESALAKKFS